MKEISKAKMVQLYEKGLVTELINTGDRIYARSVENSDGVYEVVYCGLA